MLQELWIMFPLFRQSITFSKIFFFPSAIIERNNLDSRLRNYKSASVFKKKIRPSPNSIFDCQNPEGIKLITRLGVSHLRKDKFKHSF